MSQKDLKQRKKAFIEAMNKTFGNVTQSCKILDIDRSTPYKWCDEDKEFEKIFKGDTFGEQFKDMVESKLSKLAIQEHPTVLIFLAKTKLKDRGYIERTEHDFSGLGEIVVKGKKPL